MTNKILHGFEIRPEAEAHNYEPQLLLHFIDGALFQLVSTKEGSGPGSVKQFWARVGDLGNVL